MPKPLTASSRVVIVGASLCGLSAAEELRSQGYHGRVIMIGDEVHEPYDRPPLSKQALLQAAPMDTTLPRHSDIDLDLKLGVRAIGVDPSQSEVMLADGRTEKFDRLLIATGARARSWPVPEGASISNLFTIRGKDDSGNLALALAAKPSRVLVIGGGFIGCEVASACRELGLAVTMVVREATPLQIAVGSKVGALVAELAREKGVDLRLETGIKAFDRDSAGRAHAVHLSSGKQIAIDLVIAAIGTQRNVEWVRDCGLAVDERGVRCDRYCRVLDTQERPLSHIFVGGDVARWPRPSQADASVAVEHWGNAVAQGQVAARNMLCDDEASLTVHDHLPNFWSSQFGVNIKMVGLAGGADRFAVVQGSMRERRFVAAYGARGRTVAALSINSARWLPAYQSLIQNGAAFPPIKGALDQGRISPQQVQFA